MTGDTFAMSQEIVELQTRVSELMVALERVTEQRDNSVDAAESLHTELEATKNHLREAHATVSRLRVYIAQGVEL
jgi:predicted  nucleic acid-binding Zn-ribbon protein